jgi:CHAD domain-containing protein
MRSEHGLRRAARQHASASRQAVDEAPTAMSFSSSPVSQATAHAERKLQPRRSIAQLNAAMACDTAFRVIARGCLEDLTANRAATCRSDHAALHDMRIALTRLRAAISFFSPMVVDSNWHGLKRELKWLNAKLGAARDVDVAIDRLKQIAKLQPHAKSDDRFWNQKSTEKHRALARALRSPRYQRLIKNLSAWIETGPWSTANDPHMEKRRACPITRYSTRKLTQWREKLLKKAGGLEEMGAKKRHRLRLASKKLRYSIEFSSGLRSDQLSSSQASLKHLRKAQQCLGELNDAVNGQALMTILQRTTGNHRESHQFVDRQRERQLMRSTIRAYRKLDQLKSLHD